MVADRQKMGHLSPEVNRIYRRGNPSASDPQICGPVRRDGAVSDPSCESCCASLRLGTSQTLALQLDTVSVVNDSIHNRIGESGITHDIV